MGKSKIIYGGEVLIDLTSDTIMADVLLAGYTAHGKDGEPIEGTCTFDSDTSGDTAAIAEVLIGKTFHARGAQGTGTMPNNGAVAGKIATKDGAYIVPLGYHDGSGTVGIDDAEKAKIIPANIRDGISILGVMGEMSGSEGMKPQAKTVTPSTTQQIVGPDADEGYNCLSQVTVEAIPYVESANAAGGITVTIG